MPHRDIDTFLESVEKGILHYHLVNHDFDVVVLVTVGFKSLYDFLYFAVYACIKVAFAAETFKKLTVMTFSLPDDGGKNVDFFSGISFGYHFQNLFFGVFHHLFPRKVAVGSSCAGKQ